MGRKKGCGSAIAGRIGNIADYLVSDRQTDEAVDAKATSSGVFPDGCEELRLHIEGNALQVFLLVLGKVLLSFI